MFCKDCPFKSRHVGHYGPRDAEVVIVGESPGPSEVRKGRPFVGQSGYLLTEAMRKAGFWKHDPFITNAISCLPPRGPKKDKQINDAVRACHGRLHAEITKHPRKLIIALGNAAVRSLTGNYGFAITKKRGQVIESEYAEYGILPTLHPAHVLRNEGLWPQLLADLQKASHIMDGLPSPEIDEAYEIIDWQLARDAGKVLDRNVALDIETTGLDPWDDEFLCLGVTDGTRTLIAPSLRLASAMLRSLVKHRSQFIWFNGKFDQKFLRAKGFQAKEVPIHEDVMLLSYVLDENTGRHSLEQCAIDHLGHPAYKDMLAEYVGTGKKKKSYAEVPKPLLYRYLARDCRTTLDLFNHLRPQVSEDDDLERWYTELLIPASSTLVTIELNGLPISQEKVREAREALETRAEPLLEKIREITGSETFNPNSPQQVLPALQERGVSVKATDKETLKQHTNDALVKAILDYRNVQKLLSTYVKPFDTAAPGHRIKSNGRAYTTYNLHTTVTGRLSSSPNFQNIPQEKSIRNMITAPEGRVLLSLDYSQAELRSLAALSQDPTLLSIFKRGDDLHSAVATEMFGPNWTKQQRRAAKTVNFGIVYGMTAPALAGKLDCTLQDAQEYLDFWFDRFPIARDFIESSRKKGCITTIYGRKRRLHVRTTQNQHRLENQAGNFEHQSMCSDFTLESAIFINRSIRTHRGWPMQINIIHDDNLFEIDEDRGAITRFARHCKKLMEKIPRHRGIQSIPFRVEPEIGKSWGNLMSIEDYFDDDDAHKELSRTQSEALQIA